MNILAIDPATVTGWATNDKSGTFSVKLKSYESKGIKFLRFSSYVRDLIASNDIALVVYEKPSGRHFNGLRSHANFEGVLLKLCTELGVEYKDYSASAIKKHATGKGNCKKDLMVKAAKNKWTFDIIDDNHADALWLHDLAKKDFE